MTRNNNNPSGGDTSSDSSSNINQQVNNNEQLSPWQKHPDKYNLVQVILISFGFFASSAAWTIYNTNVNYALEQIFGNVAIVGFLMTIDNIIGVVIQPLIGSLSDRTKSRFGRRVPYLLVFVPVSAISFMIIPFVESEFVPLLIAMLIFNTSMAFWRSPTIALMPDFVAPKDRSKGNAIVNLFGGIGTAIASFIGGALISINVVYGFAFVAIIMIISLFIVFFGVKEPDTRNWEFTDTRTKQKLSIFSSMKEVVKEEEKSALYMLCAIFSWFVAHQALESLWTVYASDIFDLERGAATQTIFVVSVAFILFAVPAGYIAKKIKRKNTILIGLIMNTILIFSANFIKGSENIGIMTYIFIAYGIGWAMININSITMVWEMAPSAKHIGTYTGLYYFASFLAAILGPTIIGFFMEYVVGRGNMFLISAIFLGLAIIFMIRVKRGEPEMSAEERIAKQKAIQGLDIED